MNKKITLILAGLLLTTQACLSARSHIGTGIAIGYTLSKIVDNGCNKDKTIHAFRKDKDKLCKFFAQIIENNCQNDACKELVKLLQIAQSSELQKIKDTINEQTPEIIKDGIEAVQKALSDDNKKN